jgi:hypothetical protein
MIPPPELIESDNGRVLTLMVNGEPVQRFDLVSAGLWACFRGDALDALLRNERAMSVRYEAEAALSRALYEYREVAPLNRVETWVVEELDAYEQCRDGFDVECMRRRAQLLFDGGQLRNSIALRLSRTLWPLDD